MNKLLASVAFSALISASPAYAGQGGTHTETDTQQKTVTTERSTTHVKTVHQPNTVEDVTVVHDVNRVHPVHHVTDVTRYVHHVKHVDSDEYATHRSVAAPEVEHEPSEQVVGSPAHGHTHEVTRYHDSYVDDYSTRVKEVTGTPVIDRTIHKHVTEVIVQPIVHEHDITRVVYDNRVVHHTDHEASQVAGAARTIVTHKREDVDP